MLRTIKKNVAKYIVNFEPLLARPVADILPRFRLQILNLDTRLQFWAYKQMDHFSEEEFDITQRMKMKEILGYAGQSVPYWRELFQAIGFSPNQFKNFVELSKIPITTRGELKRIPAERLLSDSTSLWRRIPTSTSGSTGEPLKFFQDFSRDLPYRRAALFLSMHYAGFEKKEPFLTIGLADYWQHRGFAKNVPGGAIESEKFRKNILYPLFLSYRPSTIQASASNIRRLAFHLSNDKFRVPLRGIVYLGESFTDAERKDLMEFFQCPLTDSYGTRECHPVGMRCVLGSYHLLPWLNYVEVVDDGGKNCPDGKEGNIIVTSFSNWVMPFIRYQIGDQGIIEKKLCLCGRRSKVLKFLGRTPMYIKLPSGAELDLRFLEHILGVYHKEIKTFQIEEEKPGSFVIRYVSSINTNLNEAEAAIKIRAAFREMARLNEEVRIVFRKVDLLLPNDYGKTPRFVSRVGRSSTR